MAALSITVANVAKVTTGNYPTQFGTGVAGGTITAGQPLYLNTSSQLVAAQATTVTLAAVVGIALHGALAGQPVTYATAGDITIGATVTLGLIYVLGAAVAGDIAPSADLASTNVVTVLGVAISTTVIRLAILVSGATKP